MAENNLLMTIVLVVAATLLFSGGLTGNVSRSNFSNLPSAPSTLLGVVCSPVREGGYADSGDPVIWQINKDCSKTVANICADSAHPFITKNRVVECRGLAESSSTDVFPGVY